MLSIGTYELTEKEESKARELLEKFQAYFPDCYFSFKREIFGIKERNHYFMCYFSRDKGVTYVKFKFEANKVPFDCDASYDEEIARTVQGFQLNADVNGLTVPKRRKYSKLINAESVLKAEQCGAILRRIGDEYDGLCFDGEDYFRLKRVLNENGIYDVGTLKIVPMDCLLRFKSFGRTRLSELHRYLLNAISDKEYVAEFQESLQELTNLTDKFKLALNEYDAALENADLSAFNAFSDYTKNLSAYPALYERLIDYLLRSARAKLTNKNEYIFIERLGLLDKPKTLRILAVDFNLSTASVGYVMTKCKAAFVRPSLKTFDNILLEEEKYRLLKDIVESSLVGFVAYICVDRQRPELADFVFGITRKRFDSVKDETIAIKNIF